MKQRSSIGILFLIVFTDLLGFGIVIPLLPRYGEAYAASPAALGLLLAAYSLMQFLVAPIWGRLSDRFGRKPILVTSLAGSVVGYTLFAASGSMLMLILSRAFAGAMAANISTAQAYVADVTPPEGRAKGMGVVGAAFGLGFSLGPFLGGLLASLRDRPSIVGIGAAHPELGRILTNVQGLPGLFAAALSLLALLLTLFVLRESLPESQRAQRARSSRFGLIWSALRRPRVGTVYLLFFVYTFGFTQMEVTLAQLIGSRFGLDIAHSYWLFGWVGFLAAFVQGAMIGPLTRRFGESTLARAGLVLATVSLATLSFTPSVGWLMADLALLAIGGGLTTPSLSSLVSKLSATDAQGSALGVFQSISAIARIIGPIVAQLLYLGGEHPHLPYLLATLMGLIGIGLAAQWRKSVGSMEQLPGSDPA